MRQRTLYIDEMFDTKEDIIIINTYTPSNRVPKIHEAQWWI